jgi:hypothetical protein
MVGRQRSIFRYPGSIPTYCLWGLLWTVWHLRRFISEDESFSRHIFYQSSILIYHLELVDQQTGLYETAGPKGPSHIAYSWHVPRSDHQKSVCIVLVFNSRLCRKTQMSHIFICVSQTISFYLTNRRDSCRGNKVADFNRILKGLKNYFVPVTQLYMM